MMATAQDHREEKSLLHIRDIVTVCITLTGVHDFGGVSHLA